MLSFVCRFCGLSFFLLNTFKIKTICWKQSTKMEIYPLQKYPNIPLLLTDVEGASLCSHHQRCYSLQILRIHYPICMGLTEGTDRCELRGDAYVARPVWVKKGDHRGSESSTQTRRRRQWVCLRSRNISQSKRRHRRETGTNPGRKTVPHGVHSEVKSHKVRKGKEPRFRIHRQLVNNKL